MKLKILAFLCFLMSFQVFGQSDSTQRKKSIGINYFGELGFRPGIEIDYGINLWNTSKLKKRKAVIQELNFRPSIAYYHYAHYSNNFLVAGKLNYQIRFANKVTPNYFSIEPFIKLGYLRYFLQGDVYATDNNSFKKVKFVGSNSFVFGGGFDTARYLSKKLDWLIGFDYFAERTEDKLILHRFVFKVGTRIKLN